MGCFPGIKGLCSIASDQVEDQARQYRDARTTAIGLIVTAILLCVGALCLLGLGCSPGMMLTGINFVPYLLGIVVMGVSIGVASMSLLFAMKAACHKARLSYCTG